jgi:hypothetical protein
VRCLVLLVLLTGCTTSVKHLSDPRINNDGYTLACGGLEYGEQVTVEVAACYNLAPRHGEYVFAEVKYHWNER